MRRYDVVAIDVDVTLNRYLDHDPKGRMYVLEADLARVRAEEAANAAARAGRGEPGVSVGLQRDAIQPLTLRVAQGECLRITLRNALAGGEPADLHVHGSSTRVVGGGAATASNPAAMVRPGQRVTYEWWVSRTEPEGTHDFHSHGNERFQTDHGLFGAVIVEPSGSSWIDPWKGNPLGTGWAAIVRRPDGTSFREFALYYHEIGDENYQVLDRDGTFVPQVDPITGAYRPDGRALNYRSEPFLNRLRLERLTTQVVDESMEYSSYSFGDPATPIMRTYLGDPVKQRVIHGGGESLHVHHVHGGGIRWKRQPRTEPSGPAGLDKHPLLVPTASDRTDSQALGPSETYDIEDECGSGGCQQSVGDFMYHCHVAHHYFAGMWGIWRVYNTLQDGRASTDAMPPLVPLPDRAGSVVAAVSSDRLAGTTVDSYGSHSTVTDVGAWVKAQLPPSGAPRGYDASVWNWKLDGNVALGEPEDTREWAGYRSAAPGSRPPILFDPRTGKPAYPMLRPHLAQRPPFAADHGPAPYLDPIHAGGSTAPPDPGANGAGSVCPTGTRFRPVAINAITVPIVENAKSRIVDPNGELFVLRSQEDAVRADPRLRVPLVLRTNAGQDCLNVLLRSEVPDGGDNPFSKVGMHIHFVQFDVQGSDGVDTGFNFEQTVRPFTAAGTPLAGRAAAGDRSIRVADAARFQAGAVVGVGIDRDQSFESARILAVTGQQITFDAPLVHDHAAGEILSAEFVRYQWYPDVQFGTAFFHDHVNVITSSQHGLFGALISEPPGSTYTDPHTGGPVESGLVADIHTAAPSSPDLSGSFREYCMLVQDDNPITRVGRSSGSSLDLRVEPLDARDGPPSLLFSSTAHGDPETPLLEANLGDPIAIRTLVGGSNDVHSWHVDGHWFRIEPYSLTSPPANTVNVGISERYDLFIPSAGGPQGKPGDYLYYNGRSFKLREGSWGILRVVAPGAPQPGGPPILPLPGHEHPPAPATDVCAPNAPRREYAVSAVQVPLPMLGGSPGKIYVLDRDRAAVLAGRQAAVPLVLHADVGDCIIVHLTNATNAGDVSFHTDLLAYDPQTSGGVNAGYDRLQTVPPGATGTSRFYASPKVGPTTALVRDWGDVLHNPGRGLYAAIVVGPAGANYTDAASGADVSNGADWQVIVHPPRAPAYREFTLFFQDEDAGISTHRMPYSTIVEGTVGLNYRNAPLADRLGRNPDTGSVFAAAIDGLPSTPTLQAYAGDPVHLNVLSPWSEQAQVFSVEGHQWPLEPRRAGTNLVSSQLLAALDSLSIWLKGGAGGPERLPGDYVYGDHREPYQEAGLWGLLRVSPACSHHVGIAPLGTCGRSHDTGVLVVGGIGGVAVLVAAWLLVARRRSQHHR